MTDYITKIKREITTENVYIVGGYLRDYLLNKPPNDIDLIVDGNIKNIVSKIVNKTGGSYFTLGNNQEKITRVIFPNGFEIDFSPLQGDLEGDILQRDFTINALAYNLKDYNQAISSNSF